MDTNVLQVSCIAQNLQFNIKKLNTLQILEQPILKQTNFSRRIAFQLPSGLKFILLLLFKFIFK